MEERSKTGSRLKLSLDMVCFITCHFNEISKLIVYIVDHSLTIYRLCQYTVNMIISVLSLKKSIKNRKLNILWLCRPMYAFFNDLSNHIPKHVESCTFQLTSTKWILIRMIKITILLSVSMQSRTELTQDVFDLIVERVRLEERWKKHFKDNR